MRRLRQWLLRAALMIALLSLGFVLFEAARFDASIDKDYGIAPLSITASSDPARIARGKHLAEAVGGCFGCHGEDLAGAPGEDLGPVGVVPAPNLTTGKGGIGARYSDGQLARLLRHGVRASGKSLRFMPVETSWLADDDLQALVSYLRTLPPVDRTVGAVHIGLFGKLIDRLGLFPLDVARHVDHQAARPVTLPAQATIEYGALLARSCSGCHGDHFSGGPIPGAPAELPVPANITSHETGLGAISEVAWNQLIERGIKRDGRPLDAFMPIAMLRAMDATERAALWKFLRALPARPFGER